MKITIIFLSMVLLSIPSLTGNTAYAKSIFDEKKVASYSPGGPLLHLGIMYLGQWGFYSVSQYENIRNNGSFKNWYRNMASLHMDKDSYDYNLIKHTIAGSYYFLFYRSRGYSPVKSFFLSTASVILFEFTIETTTEKPSIQDIYQTPVLGAVLGAGIDAASLYLIRSRYLPLRIIGYILNPFRLVGHNPRYNSSIPLIGYDYQGYHVSISF